MPENGVLGGGGQTHISVKPFEFHLEEALQMDLIFAKILEQLLARSNCRCIDDLVELLADNRPPTVAVQAERLNEVVYVVVKQCVMKDVPSLFSDVSGHEAVRQGAIEGVASLTERWHVNLDTAKVPVDQSASRPNHDPGPWYDSYEPYDKSSYFLCGFVHPHQHVLAMGLQRQA